MKELTIDNDKSIVSKEFEIKKVERQSGLELLRIIAMLMIILHHLVVYFDIEFNYPMLFAINIFALGGKLGVNIFVIISAYFMVDKKFKLSRVFNIIIQAFFYSIAIYFIFVILGEEKFNPESFFNNVFPIYTNKWWFVTTYIIFLFLVPVFNLFLQNISRKLHKTICLVLIILFSVMPIISLGFTRIYVANSYLNEVCWFITLYFIVSYIKFYDIKIKKLFLFLTLLFVWIIQISICMVWDFEFFCDYTLANTILALTLFLLFKDLKFKSKFVNTIASTTFGVYLIHENNYIRKSWRVIVPYFNGFVGNYFLTFLLLAPIVFIICSIIDFIRLKTIHRLTKKLLNKVDKKIDEKFKEPNKLN